MNGFGNDLLREARRRRGLSQTQFASQVGTSRSSISKLERGLTSPSFDDVIRFLRTVGLDLDFMLVERDESDWSTTVHGLLLSPDERFRHHEQWSAQALKCRNSAGLVEPMAPLPTVEIFRALLSHPVEFVVLGGYAAIAHGSPFMETELEIAPTCIEGAPALSAALSPFMDGVRQRVIIRMDARESCVRDAEVVRLAGIDVRVAALADVISMKQISNQLLDQRVLPTLREILASRNPRNRARE